MTIDMAETDEVHGCDANVRIGFIGCGKMASALLSGFISTGLVKEKNTIASALHEETLVKLKHQYVDMRTSLDSREVARSSDVIILAVKPHIVANVLGKVYSEITPEKLVISVAAGLTLQTLENLMPAGSRVVRVMPNTPALVVEGATAFSCGTCTTAADAALVQSLFSSVGLCEQMDEKYIDIICGMAGSGCAYMFMGIEALADGAVRMGLPRKTALTFAAQCMLGSAKMVRDTEQHPAVLKDNVCSPGGTTIAGVHALERGGYRGALMNAVEAAVDRGRQIGKS